MGIVSLLLLLLEEEDDDDKEEGEDDDDREGELDSRDAPMPDFLFSSMLLRLTGSRAAIALSRSISRTSFSTPFPSDSLLRSFRYKLIKSCSVIILSLVILCW